jgi:hypothetical protein
MLIGGSPGWVDCPPGRGSAWSWSRPGIVALPDWRGELPPADRASAADAFGSGAVARIS